MADAPDVVVAEEKLKTEGVEVAFDGAEAAPEVNGLVGATGSAGFVVVPKLKGVVVGFAPKKFDEGASVF